ncbi:hypothetical protein CgunFtcFv8_027634 [Champsocephalus gunnari]|uniref:Uncharacterized protein n=1 Tax=Champsocephalus gunnari TaxID=52237 RepID=A0AAN8EH64_CHAGU|nr:hypothetical protein CgunFtcFv8_027634 [Champsocephalus gunnari]
MLTPDTVQPIIRSCLNDCTGVGSCYRMAKCTQTPSFFLQGCVSGDHRYTLTILITEVTLPQVNKWMDRVEEDNHKHASITASFSSSVSSHS